MPTPGKFQWASQAPQADGSHPHITDLMELPSMKPLATSLLCVLAVGGAMTAVAQTPPAPAPTHTHHAQPVVIPPRAEVAAAAQPAVDVVERFGKSLAAGDLKAVETLLDANVLILETGGAERSRDEYLSHHAIGDAQFLKGTRSELKRRTVQTEGDLAWVGTESELHASKDGQPMTLLSTETMVLKNTSAGWRIVHIHWSSRPKKTQ